jgi:hypothetical protein
MVSSWGVRELLQYEFGIGLITNIDDTSDADYTYIGQAIPGSASSDTAWSILKITKATGSIAWAKTSDEGAGHPAFNKVWDNRASYTYN